MQVNTNPTLLDCTVDSFVNRSMIPEMFNIVGFHIPHIFQKLTKHTCHDTRMYSKLRTKEENDQIEKFMSTSEKREIDLTQCSEVYS